MLDRIGELRLRVTTDIPGRDEELRRAAETFARAVLERCGSLLEERAPGRLVLLRELPLRWRLVESGVGDPEQIEQFAETLVDALERSLPAPMDLPPPDTGVVVFEDEAHQTASFLLARAYGRVAWFHASARAAGEPLEELALPEKQERAIEVLARLARADGAVEALAAAPRAAVSRLAAALAVDAAAGAGAVDQAVVSLLRSIRSGWPRLDGVVERLALLAHALVAVAGDRPAPSREALGPARRAAVTVAAEPRPQRAGGAAAARAEVAPRSPAAVDSREAGVAGAARPAEGVHSDAAGGTRVSPMGTDAPARAAAPGAAAAQPAVEALPPAARPLIEGETYDTRFAGLFYLFAPILELGLGELLWQACLPEQEVLAHAAAALLAAGGDPDAAHDPAVRLFAGATADRPFPEVDPAQHQEVVLAVTRALAAALPRRALAKIPPVVVSVVPHARGRMLVAAAEGSPFVFFAWPAVAPADLNRGLDALLSTWPAGAPLLAAGAMASIAPGGRMRPCHAGGPEPFLPAAPSAVGAALLACAAGAPCQLLASRAGDDPAPAVAELVKTRLAGLGRAQLLPREMYVRRDAEAVDLSLRRAGLDRDPGWVPWLDRTVRIIFGEA